MRTARTVRRRNSIRHERHASPRHPAQRASGFRTGTVALSTSLQIAPLAALTQRFGTCEPRHVGRGKKQWHCGAVDESLDADARLARHEKQRLPLPVVTGTLMLRLST